MNKLYNKILTHKYIPKLIGIALIICINWAFQGIFYTKKTETIFKILYELSLLFIFCNLFIYFIDMTLLALFVGFLTSHTINWLINNNLFSLFKTFKIFETTNETFISYVEKLKIEIQQNSSIMWVGIFGSQTLGEHSPFSDIDVRVVRNTGLMNAVRSFLFVQKQRLWANLNKFPLDIYLLDNINELSNMSELAIVLKPHNGAY